MAARGLLGVSVVTWRGQSTDVRELIDRRRRQILVHSYLYYKRNTNIIDDATFDMWSKELADLQQQHPEIARTCVYADGFEEFDGSSGYDLPYHIPDVMNSAEKLYMQHKKRRGLR
jgi:NAD-dependent DNA ligase adenylation domain